MLKVVGMGKEGGRVYREVRVWLILLGRWGSRGRRAVYVYIKVKQKIILILRAR